MRGKHSSLILFVRGLSGDVSSGELKSFVRTRLSAQGLKTKTVFSGLIGDCNILRITDPETGAAEFHGLIEVRPAELAMRAIDILDGTEFKGRRLAIHRYRQRSSLPGHRRQYAACGREEPRQEQRRSILKIDLVESTAAGLLTDCRRLFLKSSSPTK